MKNLEKSVNHVMKRINACIASNCIYDKIDNNFGTSKDMGFPTDFKDFRRMIGNPYSKVLKQYQDMAPFQEDYHYAIQEHHWVISLKSRKIGATDTAITSFALNAFDRYAGHDMMIVAGNELRIAKEILLRFYEFFTDLSVHDFDTLNFSMLYCHAFPVSFTEPSKDILLFSLSVKIPTF